MLQTLQVRNSDRKEWTVQHIFLFLLEMLMSKALLVFVACASESFTPFFVGCVSLTSIKRSKGYSVDADYGSQKMLHFHLIAVN